MKQNFWNEAARYGAVVGAVVGLSSLAEYAMILHCSVGTMLLYLVEWLAVVVLHYYLLHRFTRTWSRNFSSEEGFPFSRAYGFVLTVSLLAGVILGAINAVFFAAYGYDAYVTEMLAALETLLQSAGAAIPSTYAQLFDQLKESAAPSVLATLFAGVKSSLFFGIVYGLIIAGVLSRPARPFDNEAQHE